jgi:2',3'-cyclic-nucleotide 2'-phosphodiesterase/3'-nucleotidase/5'-nucleotidase
MIGSTQVDLDGVRENVRSRETNLANLIADSMLQSIKQLPGFESQFGETFIAVQNGAFWSAAKPRIA